MNHEGQFEFVVQDSSETWHRLTFRFYDATAKPWFSTVWQRMATALSTAHQQANSKEPDWVKWKTWDWCEQKRPGYEARQVIVAWCGPQVAGFLNVWGGFASQFDEGQKTLYIEHVAAAPWNQNTELWRRQYSQTGTALLAYAVKFSQDQGYGGRVSLHASNESALAFYRRVTENRIPRLFYDERMGVVGPTPHGTNDIERPYLEMTPDGSINLLEDYRHE